MAGNHGHHHHQHNNNKDDDSGVKNIERDNTNTTRIGLCEFLRDDDRPWETFTTTIKSWKLTVRNSKEFHAGNITFLEKIDAEKATDDRKKQSPIEHTIAIDSGCPPNDNRNLGDDLEESRHSFYLINTHGHHDHILGNSMFAEAGAQIVAQRNARNLIAKNEGLDPSALPSITFRDEMSLFIDDIVVKLIHLPSGHTNGDLAVWIPKLNILHTGDTFMSGGYPLIDSINKGRIRGLIKAISTMIRITDKNTLIIPGHGNLETGNNGSIEGPNRQDLIKYRHMLRTVTAEVEKLKQMGYSLAEINATKPTQSFDKEWDNNLICPESFVSFIYNTLPGKKEARTPCKDASREIFPVPTPPDNPPKRRKSSETTPAINLFQPPEEIIQRTGAHGHDSLIGTPSLATFVELSPFPLHSIQPTRQRKGTKASEEGDTHLGTMNSFNQIPADRATGFSGDSSEVMDEAIRPSSPFDINEVQPFDTSF